MFENVALRLFLSSLFCTFLFSCEKNDNAEKEENEVKFISFAFLKKDNPSLEKDIFVKLSEINENGIIDLFVPHLVTDSLVACFSGKYYTVEVNGIEQKSGVSKQNFNDKVIYNLKSLNGGGKNYEFQVKVIMVFL